MIKISRVYRSTKYNNQCILAVRGGNYLTYPECIKIQSYNADDFTLITDSFTIENLIKAYNSKMEHMNKVYGIKIDNKLAEYVGSDK